MISELIDVGSALLVPAIALLAVAIAWAQWRINRTRLRLELFDRRYEVYKAVRRFLDSVLREGGVRLTDEEANDSNSAVTDAQFLYGEDVSKFMIELRQRAINLRIADKHLEGIPVGEERTKKVEQSSLELEWIIEQHTELIEMFRPYLRIKER